MLVVPALLLVGLVVLVRLVLSLLTRTSATPTCPRTTTTPRSRSQAHQAHQATCRRKAQLEATDSEEDILDYLGDSTGPTSDDSS